MSAEDVRAARVKALCERKSELCVKYHEIVRIADQMRGYFVATQQLIDLVFHPMQRNVG